MKHIYYRKSVSGFSFLELILILAVIGILATIAIPRFGTTKVDAQDTVDERNLIILQKQVERYRMEIGSYPDEDGLNNLINDTGYFAGGFPAAPSGKKYTIDADGIVSIVDDVEEIPM
ncbi:MAG: hypothetical protein HRT87_02740 [Legionellales bacterium]|nr:hypothetical protein [Legionellales bacterium]